MGKEAVARNLKRLRIESGMKQYELAESAGITRQGYSLIERGRSDPQVPTLRALAEVLGVPMKEIVSDVPVLKDVRFRSLKRLRKRDDILHQTAVWLSDFNELEQIVDQPDRVTFGDLIEHSRNAYVGGAAAVAAAAREYIGLSKKEPVHDICGLLESQGVKLKRVAIANDAYLGMSVARGSGGPAIVVNTWDRLAVEHWIFSAAHELGHLLMHLDSYDVEQSQEDDEQEREANAFASHFLMPHEVFLKEWEETAGHSLLSRVLKVKRLFRVSWRTVAYRITEGLVPELVPRFWKRLNWEYSNSRGCKPSKLDEPQGVDEIVFSDPRQRSSEPAGLDAIDFQEDYLNKLVRRTVEAEQISLSRGAEVLGLSINEMRELSASWID